MKSTGLQMDKIGSRLREVRLLKEMTLIQFYSPVTGYMSNCSAIELGKRNIGVRMLSDIAKCQGIDVEWLKTGVGSMFIQELDDPGSAMSALGVPFFNVNLADISFDSFGLLKEAPEYYVNYRPFNDCDAYLPIYGDSMYPRYASGEIIAVREIRNFDIIQWGEAYLIVADERANSMTTVKLLFEHSNERKFILRSSNPHFMGDTVIDKEVVKRLFIVKGKVTRNQL